MQYDTPVQKADLASSLTNNTANFSSLTLDAISSLLGLEEAGTVSVAGVTGNSVQFPSDQSTPDIVLGEVAGNQGDSAIVDLSAAEAAGVQAFVLQSQANLVVNLEGQAAAPEARVAGDEVNATAEAAGPQLVVVTGNGDDTITVKGDQDTLIESGLGNDIITTGNGNNTVIAGEGNNNVTTGSGDDTVILSGANKTDVVNTGEGYDVVQLDGSRDDYSFQVGNNFNVNLTGNQTAQITNAEFLKFVDQDGETSTVALAHSEAEAVALRLYEGLLGRDADQNGAKDFTAQVNAGTSLTDIANQFLGSDEYQAATNGVSVNELYNSLLGRDVDEGGAATWQGVLANGGTLADVAAAIAVSDEAQANDTFTNTEFVEELYTSALGRDADDAGLADWVSQLFNGASRADVAKGIVGSTEATEKANGDFINSLYNSALDRDVDAGGKATWMAVLENGGTKADVALGIIGSQEAADHIDNVVVLHGQV